jgi:NAD(P)-dependent dehydrogenase (short-subunit alcohol dehydrogenase family)
MEANANSQPLAGKVAVVTGAGRGIGRAIAVGFGQAGARVCCAVHTESEILAVPSQIQQVGGRVLTRSRT